VFFSKKDPGRETCPTTDLVLPRRPRRDERQSFSAFFRILSLFLLDFNRNAVTLSDEKNGYSSFFTSKTPKGTIP